MTGRVLLLAAALAVPALLSSAGGAGDGQAQAREPPRGDGRLPRARGARTPASASATWCGTATSQDVEPNVVAGHPVHWLYAVPSDAPDRFSTFSHVMQTDAEAIDAWWRREDPARTLRNDLRQLSCGAQLDASSLRLPLQGAVLDDEFGFGDIFESLDDAGFDSGFAKYIVYYDGPVQEPDLCGLGGSFGSVGLAVVYVRACLGASTAAIAAHELLHTLGAVPDAAPNNCPPPHDGHTCVGGNPDTPNSDLMWWRLGNQTLEQKLLDPGRDDYYGHSSPFTDTRDASWLVRLDQQVPLRLNVTGPGTVTADVPGLRCTRTCTTTWNSDTLLRLSARANASAKRLRWSGACSGVATSACDVSATPGKTVGVVFAPLQYRLTVGVKGQGTVRASRGGIACRPRCSASVTSHVPVRLTAKPRKGWKLRSWTGACKGKKRTCTVPMSKATSARAVFVRT